MLSVFKESVSAEKGVFREIKHKSVLPAGIPGFAQ